MTSLRDLSIIEASRGLNKRKFSASELVKAHVDAAQKDQLSNSLVEETFVKALASAKTSDKRLNKGEAGLLEGIPLAIKDLFCTKGVLSTACSQILKGFVPTYESTVTENLWREGAVMIGKANMDEFAMGSSNTTSCHGPVVNPWSASDKRQAFVPGGSSGGSAAAVAAKIAMGATGTDTGGSIRQPAAFCGVVGLKPTYGRCSRWGIIAFASSLDQAGPITRSVEDAALMLQVMAGYDPKDSTSVNVPVPDYTANLSGHVKGLKIGVPEEYFVDGMPEEINKLWENGMDWFRREGANVSNIKLPHTKYSLPTYYIVAPAECSSNLARYDGVRYGLREPGKDLTTMYEHTRAKGFGDEVKRRILIGTYVLSAGYYDAYYLKAQKLRSLIAKDFKQAFQTVDLILTPTTPSSAFAIEEKMTDPITMYLNDVFTVPASLAGLPAVSVPVGLSREGLPLGLQLIGRPFEEGCVLNSAALMETASDFTYLAQ